MVRRPDGIADRLADLRRSRLRGQGELSRRPVRLSSSALLLVVESLVVRLSDRPAGCCRRMAAVGLVHELIIERVWSVVRA